MFCCTLLYVHSSIAIILMGKRELVALLNLSSWCLVMVERLFLAVPQGCLRFVIVVFPDHTHLLFDSISIFTPASNADMPSRARRDKNYVQIRSCDIILNDSIQLLTNVQHERILNTFTNAF